MWLLSSTVYQTTPQPRVFKQFSVFTVLWRLAQLGDSHSGVLSCDCNQGAAGLESSKSSTGLQVQESHVWRFGWDGWYSWGLARHLSSPSLFVRLSWGSSSSWPDGLKVDFWHDSRLPPEWVSQGCWGKWKSFFWPAAEVTWHHLYLMLVSQKPVTGERVFKGRAYTLRGKVHWGHLWHYRCMLLIELFLHIFAVSLLCHQNFYLWLFVFCFFLGRLSRILLHHHLLHQKR